MSRRPLVLAVLAAVVVALAVGAVGAAGRAPPPRSPRATTSTAPRAGLWSATPETYIALLGRVVGLTGWRCLAYCLMDNHVHLLIETPRPNLGVGIQELHGRYARRFNDRHRRGGHLFPGRFGATRVTRDAQLWATVRYIALNPVTAGLCGAPAQWRWSSAGVAPAWLDSERLLGYLLAV